jgi:hypothetical protein
MEDGPDGSISPPRLVFAGLACAATAAVKFLRQQSQLVALSRSVDRGPGGKLDVRRRGGGTLPTRRWHGGRHAPQTAC